MSGICSPPAAGPWAPRHATADGLLGLLFSNRPAIPEAQNLGAAARPRCIVKDFPWRFTSLLGQQRTPWPNPSVKPSPNGGPPGPVWRYAVHFRQPGPGVPPLCPAYLER